MIDQDKEQAAYYRMMRQALCDERSAEEKALRTAFDELVGEGDLTPELFDQAHALALSRLTK